MAGLLAEVRKLLSVAGTNPSPASDEWAELEVHYDPTKTDVERLVHAVAQIPGVNEAQEVYNSLSL